LVRAGNIPRSDVLKFVQNNKKTFPTPESFIGETKEAFVQSSQGVKPKELLNWDAKEVANKPYRIKFRRHPPKNANDPATPDTAFYFDSEAEYKKMLNLFKGIQVLDRTGAAGVLLAKLEKSFQGQMALKVKQILRTRNSPSAAAKKSDLLANFNKRVLTKLNQTWREQALERKRGMEGRERQANAILDSELVANFDQRVLQILQRSWREQAVQAAQSTKEDINILFNTLEITPSIRNPKIVVEIRVGRETPEQVRLNGQVLNQVRRFELQCVQADAASSGTWKILEGSNTSTPEQRRFVRDNYVASVGNLAGEKFSLHFQDFLTENLRNIDITIRVSDSTSDKAYYNTSLRAFQIASKRGKNVWLCLSTNKELKDQYPLIHFRVESRPSGGRPIAAKSQRFANTGYVEDTYYNYKFKFPLVTPEQRGFLELLPWKIIDDKTRELENQKTQDAYIQRIRYRLLKHYHQTSTRQLALLKKNAYIWADLVEELATNLPNQDIEDQSQVIANEEYLRNMLAPATSRGAETGRLSARPTVGGKFNRVVSYLLKRDLWESKTEWAEFYKELENLCRRGVPPQYRLEIWSEMSRVVYFIRITEEVLGLTGAENEEDVFARSENAYRAVLGRTQSSLTSAYQELEDDILSLREQFGNDKLPYERNVRNICKAFIAWSTQFSNPKVQERVRHSITYSRTVATLCYGLLVNQNCSFIEGNEEEEEHRVFWLLIALSCYVFSFYFETNENPTEVDNLTLKKEDISRKRNNLTNSASLCNRVKGIKSDLLLLKILLRTNENDLYTKIEEFGLPLEYYFGDHMLNLLFTLFNPGTAFRIWDVLFFEGSSANQPKCNRIIVCLLYNLLIQCKSQLLKARNADDIRTIIDLYAKFQTNSDEFIEQAYKICKKEFEQELPKRDSIADKINFIKFAFFNNDFNKFDKKILGYEEKLADHFDQTFQQNKKVIEFLQGKSKNNQATFSYHSLSSLIRKFAQDHGNSLVRDKIERVWVKIANIATSSELADAKVRLVFGKQIVPDKEPSPISAGLETSLDFKSNQQRYLNIELLNNFDERTLKVATIDLATLPLNTITKLSLRFSEEEHHIYNQNYVSSEVEVAVLLEAPVADNLRTSSRKKINPQLLDLEDAYYKNFKGVNFDELGSEISKQDTEYVFKQHPINSRSLFSWKENFASNIDDFVKTLSGLAPFSPADSSKLKDICRAISKANKNGTFFASDFFTLLIINNRNITINQKFSLIYDLLSNSSFNTDFNHGQVTLENLTGVARDLYEIFLIHIPRNQLDNIVEQAVTGSVSSIREVTINGAKADVSREALNAVSNYLHLYHNTKDINLHSGAILRLLASTQGVKSLSSNKVEIVYLTEGRTHRLNLEADQNWKATGSNRSGQEVPRLLETYRNVVELNPHPHTLTREQFIRTLQGLPLINYLVSLENLDSSAHGTEPKNVKYTVVLSDETVYSIQLKASVHTDRATKSKVISYRKKRFQDFQNRWAVFTRKVTDRLQGHGKHDPESYKVHRFAGDAGNIPAEKLDIYLPYGKILQNIKKSLIKEITTELDQSIDNFTSYHPQLYDDLLYSFGFDVSIKVNDDAERIQVSPQSSPFQSLLDLPQAVKDVEVIYHLDKAKKISDPYIEPYNQLALYKMADGSEEWAHCKISYKFIFDNSHSSEIDGYGVVFQRHPQETVLKNASEVIIDEKVDLNSLELRRVDSKTWRAVIVDQTSDFRKTGR